MKNETYFAVIGKTPKLSLTELELIKPVELTVSKGIAIFGSEYPHEKAVEQLKNLGGVIKRGLVGKDKEKLLEVLPLEERSIVGVNEKGLGIDLKKNFGFRRFKEIELFRSDLEIKKKGVEMLDLGVHGTGLVRGRQHIPLYEEIDFNKPSHGMQIGMMPSKLAHVLVNIGKSISEKKDEKLTVWDPFCGFGTTGFIANHLGDNFIGSDINITPGKQNKKRREGSEYKKEETLFTVFEHDVLDPFTQPFLNHVDVIVTEGRLGPVMTERAVNQFRREDLDERRLQISVVYSGFLKNLHAFLPKLPMVITYPQRTFFDHDLSEEFQNEARSLGYTVDQIGEPYQRKGQQVARRVLVMRVD